MLQPAETLSPKPDTDVKTESCPTVPAEDLEESVSGGEDDYCGGGDDDYGGFFDSSTYEADDDDSAVAAGPSVGAGPSEGGVKNDACGAPKENDGPSEGAGPSEGGMVENVACGTGGGTTKEDLIKKGVIMETSNGLICLICGYSVTNFSKVKRHVEGRHSIGSGYPCPLCDKLCKTENDRQMHVKGMHKKSFSQAELMLMARNKSRWIGSDDKHK